jgi:hypothetical protein
MGSKLLQGPKAENWRIELTKSRRYGHLTENL